MCLVQQNAQYKQNVDLLAEEDRKDDQIPSKFSESTIEFLQKHCIIQRLEKDR